MKKIIFLLTLCLLPVISWGSSAENEVVFRAMADEMKRTLKELHLPGEKKPYYVAYHVQENFSQKAEASLGDRLEGIAPLWQDQPSMFVLSILSIGDPENNNTGFYAEGQSWKGSESSRSPASYAGIRQSLWQTSNDMYLGVIDQYKQKQSFARRKNIQNKLPDVVPAAQGTYIEEIPSWQPFDRESIYHWVEKVSALGTKKKFIDDFLVSARQQQTNVYYLNSRGAKKQLSKHLYQINIQAKFRQPDGYEEKKDSVVLLKNFSIEELTRAEKEIVSFLDMLQEQYGAPEAEIYLGPVLYKPKSAAGFLVSFLLSDFDKTTPWWSGNTDEDLLASPLRKKLGQRMISPGITIYDRPHEKTYEGIFLEGFNRIDWEGVPTENLTLVTGGRVKEIPLSQRPLTSKKHKSNGHALLLTWEGIREGYSNIFIESENSWTDEQMEEKLLVRCKELALPYCYIKHGSEFQRIYTQDRRKEWVVGLQEVNMSSRSLRDILAVGGKRELVDRNIVTPSVLVDEVELEPMDRKPSRKPLIAKPE